MSYFHSLGQLFHPHITLIHLMLLLEKKQRLPETQSPPFSISTRLAGRNLGQPHKEPLSLWAQPMEAPPGSALAVTRILNSRGPCHRERQRPGEKGACHISQAVHFPMDRNLLHQTFYLEAPCNRWIKSPFPKQKAPSSKAPAKDGDF